MVSAALPLPIEPKMKFESRDWMSAFAVGYTTLGASGPATSGIGGSAGDDGAPAARASGDGIADAGAGEVAMGCSEPPQPTSRRAAPIDVRRMRGS